MKNYTPSDKAPKSALYIRVSTLHQIDKDSLPMQRDDLINYTKYVLNIPDYEIFEDAGFSGKNTERPKYQEMMSRIRNKEFTHLIVWKIDRISRNLLDFASMYAELKKLDVTFVSRNEQFDTSSAMGEAMLKIILIFAELERNMTSERVTATMLSKASNGDWNGGKIPYGYNYDKESKTFSINESESQIVIHIYNTYLKTKSILETARTLNAEGFRTRNNCLWSLPSISKILKSPFYIGDYLYNVHDEQKSGGNTSSASLKNPNEWITSKEHHVGIIDPALQQEVLSILDSNNKRPTRQSDKDNIYIFSGLLECGNCGNNIIAGKFKPNKNGKRPSYYVCTNHKNKSECTNPYINEKYLLLFVFNFLANLYKAKNNCSERTSKDVFEKKLLRGEMFSEISHLDPSGLDISYYTMLHSKEYLISNTDLKSPSDSSETEYALLTSERKKHELALKKWDDLYAYSPDMPIAEYIKKHQSELDSLNKINKRLSELKPTETQTENDISDTINFYLLSEALMTQRTISCNYLFATCDELLLKKFANLLITKIVIFSGKITEIHLKNGIIYKFIYKTQEP